MDTPLHRQTKARRVKRVDPQDTRVQLNAQREADYQDYIDGFSRNLRGTLWRRYRELTLSVFPRSGKFHWCIADADGPTFSSCGYELEQDALDEMLNAIEQGW